MLCRLLRLPPRWLLADLNVSPEWELNFGIGAGLTTTSEHWIVKAIVGRRFKR